MKVFPEPGPDNTDDVLALVKERECECRHIVVASVTGRSLRKACSVLEVQKLIGVTCPSGMYFDVDKMATGPFNDIAGLRKIRDAWKERGLKKLEMGIPKEDMEFFSSRRVRVVKGSIPFFSASFSMRIHLRHVNSMDIAAKTIELFSTGTLVCLETVMMAVDSGALSEGINVIALAGTEQGLDTACIIRSCASATMYHPEKGARIVEYIAKPGISYIPNVDIDYLRS